MQLANTTQQVTSVVTYDGLPVSSGGGHALRTRDPRHAYEQVTTFLSSCTRESAPPRFTFSVVSGPSIPASFSQAVAEEMSTKFGKPQIQGLGDDRGLNWAVDATECQSLLSYICSLGALPKHPHGLQVASLSMLSSFVLVDRSGSPLPCQSPVCFGHYQPSFGRYLGASHSYARFSGRSTLSMFLNFPFDSGSDLDSAVHFVQEHLPFKMSKSAWKRWSLTRRGDSYVGRKILMPGVV